MPFSRPVGHIINHILAQLAVADAMSLAQLWKVVCEFTDISELDALQKNVVWRGLMSASPEPLFTLCVRGEPLSVTADLVYGEVLARGSEAEVELRPTEDCSSRYLANTSNYQMLKTQIGPLPFKLLPVIARHGARGILNGDLARESGQDIRSIKMRLQKLVEADLIVCKTGFLAGKHTTQSVHVRFAEAAGLRSETGLGVGGASAHNQKPESLDESRDTRQLTVEIIAALKAAPNGLRGLSDLKMQLGLHRSVSAQKFFRRACLDLHRSGNIEKVSVELPETKQLVQAIQFRRDLPEESDQRQGTIAQKNAETSDEVNANDTLDFGSDFGSDSELDPEMAAPTPVLNTVFPIYHQLYMQIAASGTSGVTSGEISKNLMGAADYRPHHRLSELYTTYLSNTKDLKPCKKYAEPYDETSVTKLFENEGKLRFYKFFATQNCTEKKPAPRKYTFVQKPSKLGLEALEGKLGPLKKSISNEAIRAKKQRMTQLEGSRSLVPMSDLLSASLPASLTRSVSSAPAAAAGPVKRGPTASPSPAKRQRVRRKATDELDELDDIGDIGDAGNSSITSVIDVALAAQDASAAPTRVLRRRRAAPKSFVPEETYNLGGDSGDDYEPQGEADDDADVHMDDYVSDKSDVESGGETGETAISDTNRESTVTGDDAVIDDLLREMGGMKTRPEPEAQEPAASDAPADKPVSKAGGRRTYQRWLVRPETSAKAIIRRDVLLDIMRKEGGAVINSLALFRKVDQQLAGTTKTDRKTLLRDINSLMEEDILEIETVKVGADAERGVEKRILILKKPVERPTPERLVSLRKACADEVSRKNLKMLQRRTVAGDEEFLASNPTVKLIKRPVYKRGENRLDTLADTGRRGGRRGRKNTDKAPAEDGAVSAEPNTNGAEKTRVEESDSVGEGVLERLKRAKRPKKVITRPTQFGGPKRSRRNITLEQAEATTLYRCIVISRAFSRDATDFVAISQLLGDMDAHTLKRKWGTLRRSFGGSLAVKKGVDTFQNMVLHGINEGDITEEDLVKGDLGFFLEYWHSLDINTEFDIAEGMPLLRTVEANFEEYDFSKMFVGLEASLPERIEDESMRQKEFILGELAFSCEINPTPVTDSDDTLKSKLKSIFASPEGDYDPAKVKTVLSSYGEERVQAATTSLTQAREIAHILFDDSSKFVMGERFKNALSSKLLTKSVFTQAASFKEMLNDVSEAGKGLILSQGIESGEIATILDLVSCNMIELMRIDRALKFENYESRLVDKEQIGCDIVARSKYTEARQLSPKVVNVPLKGFCEPVWVNLGAKINVDLWTKILVSILAHIVFRPGISEYALHEKMQAVLSYADYCDVVGWLEESGCVERTAHNGIMATNRWQYILGY